MKHIRMNKTICYCLLLSLLYTATALAQEKTSLELKYGSHRSGKRSDADMQRWREYGLGQFIHWGVYAIPGGHWQGKAYTGAAEWIRSWDGMPKDAYDRLYKQFNPTAFDARHWAKMAKEMGAKYMIFTTKHHDGFCLWPSRYTDYTIAQSPYKKDIVKEVVDAYTAEGIDVYLYFSIIDWNHPGYRSKAPETAAEKAAYETFKQFTRNQILELLTNYPVIKGLWFDGSWDQAWIKEAAWADELEAELRAKHPGLIIGSRFRADENGKRNFDSNGQLMGDYEQGWERDLPNTIEDVHGNDWDCIMTVPENQWGYHTAWTGYVKTSYDLIDMLANSVSLSGNFVLNFGPDGQGRIRPEETLLAKEIGAWMAKNSEAIYGCEHAGLEAQGWGYYTKKGNKLYLLVFNTPVSHKLKLVFPKGSHRPEKASFLGDKTPNGIIYGGKNKKNDTIYYISIPADYKPTTPYVIELEMTDKALEGEAYQQAHT
jgi:alpha-L-fucosidase